MSTFNRIEGRHVLVVDDERHIVRLIQVNLERQGCSIDTACDGVEALARMRNCKPDLVVLDTDMPLMNGWEVLDAMAQDTELCDTPVVLLTSERDIDDDDPRWPPTGRLPSVRMYLTKPFNPVKLIEALG